MNKIFKVKQNAFGQSVVCSEKTKARGKVKSIVLAVATASAMMASVDTLAATIATGTGDGKVAMVGDSRGNIAIASKGTAGTSGVKMPLVYGQSLNAVAIGTNSEANANNTIAIGNATTALDHNDIALGNNATASGLQGSSSTGLGSVAIGNNATALTGSGVSIANNGPNNIRTSVALGTDTYANSGSVAIGFNVSARNSNVFIGSNISPGDVMSNPGSGNTVAIGSDITMKKGLFDSVILGGENTFGEGQSSTVVGTSNKADNLASSNVIGMYNNLTKSTAYILGNHNTVTNSKVGTANSLNNAWIGGSIIGSENKVANASGVVMGNALNISNSNSFLAIGNAAIVQNASNSVSLGARAYNSHERSVALGYESDSTAPTSTQNASVNGLSYGNFAGNVSDSTVSVGGIYSVGGAPLKRQIVNVAAGQIAATSTDAINGSQLYFVADTVGNLANSVKTKLGGNTALAPNGTITMTNIGGTGQNTIHDAIAFVNAKQGGAAVNVVQGDGITVTNATVNGGKTFTVGLSDATKANITKAQTDATKGIADAAAAQANATKAIADAKAADNKAVAAQNTANTAVTKADAAQA
ncbi:MAG: hypothetical protein SOW21_09220, partial [[Actinobacillus] rossii]|nr:hypothetical protein [[Actinobacillus] rossii]